ncbi:hypothetical protein MAR_005811 [Mya arenaria]|uniref:PiggyBac transposable element-derived protein domain-containing protein n=1 Tax=Mya arenaria TaxID=6604 RepID=A0ABY7F3T1_MYAAR|nr:hypothetical protein MAR_005811 [Mya arenaria]
MGGVDLHDQFRAKYNIGRCGKKWWRYIFWFILNCCIVNAGILYQQAATRFTNLNFREELLMDLIGGYSKKHRAVVEQLQTPRVADGNQGLHVNVRLPGGKTTCKHHSRFLKTTNTPLVVYGCALRYSVVNDCVYCTQCHLFAGPDACVKTLVTIVLRDWSNISKVVLSHMKSEAHLSNCDSADHFLAIMKGEKKTYYLLDNPFTSREMTLQTEVPHYFSLHNKEIQNHSDPSKLTLAPERERCHRDRLGVCPPHGTARGTLDQIPDCASKSVDNLHGNPLLVSLSPWPASVCPVSMASLYLLCPNGQSLHVLSPWPVFAFSSVSMASICMSFCLHGQSLHSLHVLSPWPASVCHPVSMASLCMSFCLHGQSLCVLLSPWPASACPITMASLCMYSVYMASLCMSYVYMASLCMSSVSMASLCMSFNLHGQSLCVLPSP